MAFDEWSCFGIPERTIDEATQWIAKLDGERVDEVVKKQFFQWLEDKPENQWAFEELAEAWAKTSMLSELQQELHQSKVVPLHPESDSANIPTDDIVLTKLESYAPYVSLTLIICGLLLAVF